MDLKIGDTVRLKSGGPIMTVNQLDNDSGTGVECIWFDESKRCRECLEAKEDALAQQIDQEFESLSDTMQADTLARWTSATATYAAEIESAKSIVLVQLAKKEDQARESAIPKAVEEVQQAIETFKEKGIVPKSIPSSTYDSQVKKAKDKLEQINKSLVRSLLMARRDDKAKEMTAMLDIALSTRGATADQPSSQSRRVWDNQSYNTKMSRDKGDEWIEVRNNGKVERKLRVVAQTDEYIEVLLLDRQHLMRLYKDHADIFKNGRWEWVANGKWID